MKKSALLLLTSDMLRTCISEYLSTSYKIETKESPLNFAVIITDNPLLLESLHNTYPQASLVLLADPGHVPLDTPFSIKVFEKPFYLRELRETLEGISTSQVLLLPPYKLYPTSRRLVNTLTQTTESLTEKEVAILEYLYEHRNRPISRETLLKNVWNYSPDITTHTLETHVYRLRQKLQTAEGSSLLLTTEDGYELKI